MGPTIITDKSFIESISIDESTWLDIFFTCNIIPPLYAETLADLSKKNIRGRNSAEELVSEIAFKCPTRSSYPNVYHEVLVINNLLGNKVDMSRRTIISGELYMNEQDMTINGISGPFPEITALQNWQDQDFTKIEKIFASHWRNSLEEKNFDRLLMIVKNISTNKFKDLVSIKNFVNNFINQSSENDFHLALDILEIPYEYHQILIHKYKLMGKPSLNEFAPYAAFVFKIKLFFYIALLSSLISKERSSHVIDLEYLFYLPFTDIFVSNDNSMHIKIAPLFADLGQKVIPGKQLKEALADANSYYTDKYKHFGYDISNKIGTLTPQDLDDNIIKDLWMEYLPNALKKDTQKLEEEINSLLNKRPLSPNKKNTFEYKGDSYMDSIRIRRKVSIYRGKWKILPINQ